MTSWVPDYSLDAPEGHTWMRSSTHCPDCPCCSADLCDRARRSLLRCSNHCTGGSDFDLSTCRCIADTTAAISAARAAVQAELDDDAAVEAGARALHAEMTRPMSVPPAWESSPYAADYRRMVQRGLPSLRKSDTEEQS